MLNVEEKIIFTNEELMIIIESLRKSSFDVSLVQSLALKCKHMSNEIFELMSHEMVDDGHKEFQKYF